MAGAMSAHRAALDAAVARRIAASLYDQRAARLHRMLESRMPPTLVTDCARSLLAAHHGGPWRAMFSWARYELELTVGWWATRVRLRWLRLRHGVTLSEAVEMLEDE